MVWNINALALVLIHARSIVSLANQSAVSPALFIILYLYVYTCKHCVSELVNQKSLSLNTS